MEETAFTKAQGWDPSGSRQRGSVGWGGTQAPTCRGLTPFAVSVNSTLLCPIFLASSGPGPSLQARLASELRGASSSRECRQWDPVDSLDQMGGCFLGNRPQPSLVQEAGAPSRRTSTASGGPCLEGRPTSAPAGLAPSLAGA